MHVPVTRLYPSGCSVCLTTKQPMPQFMEIQGMVVFSEEKEFQKYGGEKKKSSWGSHSRKEGCSSGIPSVS